MVVGRHVLRSVRALLLSPLVVSRYEKPRFRKNKLFPSRKRIHLSYRGIDPRYMGWMERGRGGVGWNDFQIKRKIKGSLVKFRNSWRVHRVPGFRISGGEAKR